MFDLGIELMEHGEVSPFFHEVVQPGDVIEVRGPIGGPFTWTTHDGGPVLFIAGGAGVVPLMSMLRHRQRHAPSTLEGKDRTYTAGYRGAPSALLLYSSRSYEDVIYRDELDLMAATDPSFQLFHTLTRKQPAGWSGYARRLDPAMAEDCITRLGSPASVFICGPAGFVEAAAEAMVGAGVPASVVHTERFGPSGA
jgi:ferredoxin-NADP reductase